MRTYNKELVCTAITQYSEHIQGFYPDEWLKTERNIALTNDREDIALFEYAKPGVVMGHYFFFSRGRQAVNAAVDFINELFNDYSVEVIIGLTPLTNKAAKWMNRRLGFKFLGIVKTEIEPCEIVMMSKKDWQKR